MTQQSPIDLAIVICTFRREALLRKALASVVTQNCPDGLLPCVIVVDNSDDGSAKNVVESFAGDSPFDIRRIEAHPPTISVARNAGVRATGASYVAFVDDDQELEPGWLGAVATAIRAYPHDVLFGAVEPVFEAPDRATTMARQLFSRQMDKTAGEELFAFGSGKTRGVALATNNSLFKRATALCDADPFDTAFGDGGGEDFDLFCRLQSRGCRFGWLPTARVRECVPASRCDAGYLRRRYYAGGQAFAAAIAGKSRFPQAARWGLRIKAAMQAAVLIALTPLCAWRGEDAFADHSYRFAGVLGKLSLGGIYPIYRESDSKTRSNG